MIGLCGGFSLSDGFREGACVMGSERKGVDTDCQHLAIGGELCLETLPTATFRPLQWAKGI